MSVADVVFTGGVYERMGALAAGAYPDEGCGVLLGSIVGEHVEVVDVTRGRNLNTERARDRYVLDPADILAADRDARARGIDIVGYWHSHPDHPAHPSQFDTDHAWVDYVYVICATTSEGTGDVNAFTLTAEGGPFEHLLLVVTSQAP
ncbi:MAG: M67 family metallopeptidase [Chloroflexi bacterium]|nr:MAG: M67 family metallopeptidase [Chloroflexota bacterium]